MKYKIITRRVPPENDPHGQEDYVSPPGERVVAFISEEAPNVLRLLVETI